MNLESDREAAGSQWDHTDTLNCPSVTQTAELNKLACGSRRAVTAVRPDPRAFPAVWRWIPLPKHGQSKAEVNLSRSSSSRGLPSGNDIISQISAPYYSSGSGGPSASTPFIFTTAHFLAPVAERDLRGEAITAALASHQTPAAARARVQPRDDRTRDTPRPERRYAMCCDGHPTHPLEKPSSDL